MASGDDATYLAGNYQEQGANRWVVGGELDIVSGGNMDVESGGSITLASGGVMKRPVQTLAKTQTATAIVQGGICVVEASTTAPTYTLAAPVVGTVTFVGVNSNTSAGTAKILSSSTGVSFTTSGANQITLGTSFRGASIANVSSTVLRLVGATGTVGVAIRTT